MKHEPRARAFVSFGANLGRPFDTLVYVLEALEDLPQTRVFACSSYYRSAPLGVTSEQPDYINAAIALDTGLPPRMLLDALLEIEAAGGRTRKAILAPRPIDLDLLLYGETVEHSQALTLPHPRLHLRAFVLLPLAEIAPGLVIPGLGPLLPLLETVRNQRIVRIRDIPPPDITALRLSHRANDARPA